MEKHAVILAAGYGKRMGKAGEITPKPLMKIANKPMILWAYERLKQAGFVHFHINIHHLASQFHSLFDEYKDITLYEEENLLDTGGGIKAMFENLPNAFLTINADCLWLDKDNGSTMPEDLWQSFHHLKDKTDLSCKALLLLVSIYNATGYHGKGDFIMDEKGLLRRSTGQFVYAGAQIIEKSAFYDVQEACFSLNKIYDKLLQQDALYGHRHQGDWFHTGDMQSLQQASTILAK